MQFLDVKIPLLRVADRSSIPMVRPVRQILDERRIGDVAAAVAAELARPAIRASVRPGQRIAIGVGSRGITDYVQVIRRVVAELVALGAEPFLVPAMGGHGAGVAAGQLEVLASLGITEASIGAPIHATGETVVLGTLGDGTPIHFNAVAAQADGIVVVNRIKPHTQFRGPVESGLTKMIVAGLGNRAGVMALHGRGTDRFTTLIPRALEVILAKLPVLFGVGLVENGYCELALIEAVPARELATREPEILRQAFESMATLFFDEVDVLVLAQFGKEISGQGADPNVMGRNTRSVRVFDGPRVSKLVALDLTEASHGNASGIGQMDIVTARFLRKVDLANTYRNVLPTTYFDAASLPVTTLTSADAVALAVANVPGRRPQDVRLVYVQDTKHLSTIYVSSSLDAAVEAHPRLAFLGPPQPILAADDADELLRWDEPTLR
ncbi:MAG: lactate racemase domain-containing protein [Proteobacteria bacterium]|nr:lactate racemase domain-containing protein [Pseudomonadota bacterium]